jgi:hypothetical protein
MILSGDEYSTYNQKYQLTSPLSKIDDFTAFSPSSIRSPFEKTFQDTKIFSTFNQPPPKSSGKDRYSQP